MTQEELIPGKVRLSPSGLIKVDERLAALGWRKQSHVWGQQAAVSVSTLRRFRARQRVTTSTFQAICQALELDWTELVEPFAPRSSFSATPEVNGQRLESELYVRRADLLDSLEQVLSEGYRVLIITGITGIGKTVLAEQLTQQQVDSAQLQLHLNFELPCYRLPFVEVAALSLRQLGEEIAETDAQNPQQLLERWVEYLVEHPCWVIMNSVEHILHGNEETGWSVFLDTLWETFFHQILGKDKCQSRLILTSQDMPADIEVHGLRYRQRLHVKPLKGFSVAAQAQLFRTYGFAPEDQDQSWSYLTRIGQAYEGHPLALQVIMGEIMSVFDGDAIAYWQTFGHEIAAAEAAQQKSTETLTQEERPKLDRYSHQLRKAVRKRIETTLYRLHQDFEDAFLLLCTAAVYREALPEAFLLSPMERRGWSSKRCQIALDALIDRYLLEVDKNYQLRQHPLIRSVALSYLDGLETSNASQLGES